MEQSAFHMTVLFDYTTIIMVSMRFALISILGVGTPRSGTESEARVKFKTEAEYRNRKNTDDRSRSFPYGRIKPKLCKTFTGSTQKNMVLTWADMTGG